jgi:hypothetical protein
MPRIGSWKAISSKYPSVPVFYLPPASLLSLLNAGTLDDAQAIATHESPRTAKLYDRTSDEITLDNANEAQRISQR